MARNSLGWQDNDARGYSAVGPTYVYSKTEPLLTLSIMLSSKKRAEDKDAAAEEEHGCPSPASKYFVVLFDSSLTSIVSENQMTNDHSLSTLDGTHTQTFVKHI